MTAKKGTAPKTSVFSGPFVILGRYRAGANGQVFVTRTTWMFE